MWIGAFDIGCSCCRPTSLFHPVYRSDSGRQAKGIAFSVDAGEPFAVHLPQGMIEKAISNILANAVSYTKPDGIIYVSCKISFIIWASRSVNSLHLAR